MGATLIILQQCLQNTQSLIFLVVKRLYSLSKFDKENPLYGRIFTPRVSAMRLSLTPDSGLPLHPLNQVLGVLPIADAEDARTTQGDALPQ